MTTTTQTLGATTFATPSDREFAISRTFDAPRSLVFDAWTNPAHVPRWMLGPDGWSMPVSEIDLRPGGAWHFVWRQADGNQMEMRGTYREIARPERLVSTESWGGEWPETLNTLTLSEQDGRTTITETVRYPSKEARDKAMATGMKEGVAQSFDRLAAHLRTMDDGRSIELTRLLEAPQKLVFKAWTEPGRMQRWFGPNGFTLPYCTIDLRPGGAAHFCMRSPDGQDIWCKGVYREVVEPEKVVTTDSFADKEGNVVEPAVYGMPNWPKEALITATFKEQGRMTKLTLRHDVGSAPAADREGCRIGWGETLDRLGAYLKEATGR
jgi:uncharacterized protein YndB with AHSA1/START domain